MSAQLAALQHAQACQHNWWCVRAHYNIRKHASTAGSAIPGDCTHCVRHACDLREIEQRAGLRSQTVYSLRHTTACQHVWRHGAFGMAKRAACDLRSSTLRAICVRASNERAVHKLRTPHSVRQHVRTSGSTVASAWSNALRTTCGLRAICSRTDSDVRWQAGTPGSAATYNSRSAQLAQRSNDLRTNDQRPHDMWANDLQRIDLRPNDMRTIGRRTTCVRTAYRLVIATIACRHR